MARLCRLASVLMCGVWTAGSLQAVAPKIVSVTPANGTTGVGLNTSLVIVFDQDMDLSSAPVPSFPPVLVGNFSLSPQGVGLSGTWDEDGRTLRFEVQSELPADTLIGWTLNPPGRSSFVTAIQNEAGEALPTVSGSFRTTTQGGQGPTLVSVTPAAGETDVDPSSSLTFVFSEAMNVSIPPLVGNTPGFSGNFQVTPPTVTYSGTWLEDGRTLKLSPNFPVSEDTVVSWTLNPAGTSLPLRSATGHNLATVSGSFTIKSDTSTQTNKEDCVGIDLGFGSFTFDKTIFYQQVGAADPIFHPLFPSFLNAEVKTPKAGPAVTSASLSLPSGTQKPLTSFGNYFSIRETATNEAKLDASFPAGSYTLRFTQSGQPERSIALAVPAVPTPVPRVTNLADAQTIDPKQDFALRWNLFSAAGSGNYVVLLLADSRGNTVFMAPNPCIPRPLAPTATSIVIPANTLAAGATYSGLLQFGKTFYSSTNAVPNMWGAGRVLRTTFFTVQTKSDGNGNPPEPARFADYRLSANQHPQLTLTGTPGQTYTVQRATFASAPQWVVAGTAVMDGNGQAVFEDPLAFTSGKRFYRAIAP